MGETSVLDRAGAGTILVPSVADVTPVSDEAFENPVYQELPNKSPLQGRVVEVGALKYEYQAIEKTAQLLGRVGVAECTLDRRSPTVTLAESAKRAKEGDQEALKLVTINAATDYMERAYKSGHVSRVVLSKDGHNQLQQYGQVLEDVSLNTLRTTKHPALKRRAKIEAHNGVRQQLCYESGALQDSVIVTWSTVDDSITKKEAKKLGYFTENMSCAVQMLTEEDGEIVLYSAFVAGADSAEGERFDIDAVVSVADQLGLDYAGLSSNEILARPALIPKTILPEGVLSLVKMYDASIGHNSSSSTRFFGRVCQTAQSYEAHLAECRRREERSIPGVKRVVSQMLAASADFNTPADAVKMLNDLNDLQLKAAITTDRTIDSNVLGQEAQQYVEAARFYQNNGNQMALLEAQKNMFLKGGSSSCPTDLVGAEVIGVDEDEASSERDQEGDCDFVSKECPKCGEKNVFTKCRRGKYYGSCGCVG